jgi:membrane-associated phospholipid phosphatase
MQDLRRQQFQRGVVAHSGLVLWAVLMWAAPASAEPLLPLDPANTPRPLTSDEAPATRDASTTTQAGTAKPHAYDFAPGEPCPYCGITPQYPQGRAGLHWHTHWNTVGVVEYIDTPLLAAVALGLQMFVKPDREAHWDRPILFDSGVRNLLRLGSPGARATASSISDVLFVASYLYPAFDDLVVAWGLRGSPSVAWQMAVIDAQAYALTFALNGAAKRVTSRARPWTDACEADPTGERCGKGGRFSSFYSGHAAVTATGAGLICAHHTQLSLYRNPYLDTGACVTAVLGTAVTGALRIASDNHWASDVLVGHMMGYLSGYLMPTLLYYKQFRVTPHEDMPPGPSHPLLTALPLITDRSAQLAVFGSF